MVDIRVFLSRLAIGRCLTRESEATRAGKFGTRAFLAIRQYEPFHGAATQRALLSKLASVFEKFLDE